jgi:hypothetical protein
MIMKIRSMGRRGARARALLRRRGARVWLLAPLVGGAIALRDSAGVLLAIMALLVLVDAGVPMPGGRSAQADERFRQLERRRRNHERLRRLQGRRAERLEVLDDRAGWASTAPRRAIGVESIAIDSITGTVEGGNAAAFDRRFRPDWSCRGRWQQVWLAQLDGVALPPIAVYRVGACHILRDGHHRVSAARDHGWSAIEAEVVELRPPIGAAAAA